MFAFACLPQKRYSFAPGEAEKGIHADKSCQEPFYLVTWKRFLTPLPGMDAAPLSGMDAAVSPLRQDAFGERSIWS
jgi:hypothetical protein